MDRRWLTLNRQRLALSRRRTMAELADGQQQSFAGWRYAEGGRGWQLLLCFFGIKASPHFGRLESVQAGVCAGETKPQPVL